MVFGESENGRKSSQSFHENKRRVRLKEVFSIFLNVLLVVDWQLLKMLIEL